MEHTIHWLPLSMIVALAATGIYILLAASRPVHDDQDAAGGEDESDRAARVANRVRILRGTGVGMIIVPVIVMAAFMLMRAADLPQSTLSAWEIGFPTASLAALSVASAVATITSRAAGSALGFFSLMLLANSGLLLLANAQFLSIATAMVYTSLCILCSLFASRGAADQELGQSIHEPLLGCISGSLLAIALIGTSHLGAIAVKTKAASAEPSAQAPVGAQSQPVQFSFADFGFQLFRDHWLGIELAGAIMLLAFIGASWALRSVGDPQSAACTPTDPGVGCGTVRQGADS